MVRVKLQGIGWSLHPHVRITLSIGNGSSYHGICVVPRGMQGLIWTMLHTEIMMDR
jgi:hypothetical protein